MNLNNLPVTYYVLEPRDQPCRVVNPRLWREFTARNLHLFETNEYYTEAYCVQWLDMFYYETRADQAKHTLV